MIGIAPTIVGVPLVLAVWALDTYLFLVVARLILGKVRAPTANRYCSTLSALTDGVPRFVDRCLWRWRHQPSPDWLPWVTVICTGLILRQVLASLVLGFSVRGA